MAGNYYFAIVGDKDNPIFEMEISPPSKGVKVCLFIFIKDSHLTADMTFKLMLFSICRRNLLFWVVIL